MQVFDQVGRQPLLEILHAHFDCTRRKLFDLVAKSNQAAPQVVQQRFGAHVRERLKLPDQHGKFGFQVSRVWKVVRNLGALLGQLPQAVLNVHKLLPLSVLTQRNERGDLDDTGDLWKLFVASLEG